MTLLGLLAGREDAVAVASVEGGALPSGRLRHEVARHAAALSCWGVRPGDAVALVVPNGPEALVATLAVAEAGCVAPLNPAFTEAEFRFYLEDLGATAVVVAGECGAVAARAAAGCSVPVFTMRHGVAGDGTFVLHSPPSAAAAPRETVAPRYAAATALLLHTSGTTSRPKLVALEREWLCRSARAIAASLRLGPADVCLNVMPLFHVHGLIGGALSSLAAGGAVCCAPGFNGPRFLRWLEAAGASWYTAVPTIHQVVAGRARAALPPGVRRSLRFVRSCSSPLPSSVRESLREVFQVPVINAYGMTEATHQVSCTPYPPAGDGPGCRDGVGLPTGPEVRVLGTGGAWLPRGEVGEIALRGPAVITAYERPAEANRTSFHEGWLRTGDEGVIDGEGGITLTGRLKELINSGGEKISPYEVEDALLRHPGVAEAVCFAAPHRARGEAVAAAVVPTGEHELDEKALRRFASGQLAAFKVPGRILLLERLPKGPTGKLQRIGLAARLGLGECS